MEPLTNDIEPLTDGNGQRKKPIILYIIIGVLSVTVIVLSILLAVKTGGKKENPNPNPNIDPIDPVKDDHLIPIKESFYINDTDDAATKYKGRGKHLNSEYYKILDIYNMKSTQTRLY